MDIIPQVLVGLDGHMITKRFIYRFWPYVFGLVDGVLCLMCLMVDGGPSIYRRSLIYILLQTHL